MEVSICADKKIICVWGGGIVNGRNGCYACVSSRTSWSGRRREADGMFRVHGGGLYDNRIAHT